MWYNLDFKRLSALLLPTFLRQQKTLCWLKSLVAPLEVLHYDFLQKREI